MQHAYLNIAQIYEFYSTLTHRAGVVGSMLILPVINAAPNPVIFYAAISNFLVLRVRAG